LAVHQVSLDWEDFLAQLVNLDVKVGLVLADCQEALEILDQLDVMVHQACRALRVIKVTSLHCLHVMA